MVSIPQKPSVDSPLQQQDSFQKYNRTKNDDETGVSEEQNHRWCAELSKAQSSKTQACFGKKWMDGWERTQAESTNSLKEVEKCVELGRCGDDPRKREEKLSGWGTTDDKFWRVVGYREKWQLTFLKQLKRTLLWTDPKQHNNNTSTAKTLPNTTFVPAVVLTAKRMTTPKAAILYFPRNQFSPRFGDTFYTFEMSSYEKRQDENCCSHKEVVFYEITVLQGKTRHNVFHRYKEFLQLFDDIKELDPDLVIDAPPSKSLYLFLYNDPTYVDQRRQSLADYMEKLLLALHNRGVPITFYRPIISFLKLGTSV